LYPAIISTTVVQLFQVKEPTLGQLAS